MTQTATKSSPENLKVALCEVCGRPESECPNVTQVYYVENLGCAHCAQKMEDCIAAMPHIQEASLSYPTKQLRVTCPHPDTMRQRFQDVCQSFEPDVVLVDRTQPTKDTATTATSGDTHAEVGTQDEAASELRAATIDAAASSAKKFHRDIISIALSAIVFAIALVLDHVFAAPLTVQAAVFAVAYLIAGAPVLAQAGKNIAHGKVFDENFLMTVASLGAFAMVAFGEPSFAEAVGVMLFYRVGEVFEDRAVERSRSQIMDAVDMRPETVTLLPGYTTGSADVSRTQVVPAENAAAGNFVLVKPGERIPLDGCVVDGESRLDTSPVTGEPVPVAVAPGSQVLSGCMNESGLLVLQVEKPLSESMVTRILDSVENAAASKPKIQRFISRFAAVYTPIVIAIAVVAAVAPPLLFGGAWSYWMYTACTFLVISCPCAIVLSVPLTYFSGIGAASKLGILFKGGSAIEALRRVRAVVMDKTGTITKGDFTVQSIDAAPSFDADYLLSVAAGAEQASTHPIAESIVYAARRRAVQPVSVDSVSEIAGKGLCVQLSEADEGARVLCGSESLLQDAGVTVPERVDDGDEAGTRVFIAINDTFAGVIRIADTIKEDSADAIAQLRQHNIASVMLTGDAEDSAQAVGRAVGVNRVHARLLPSQKVDMMRQARQEFGPVMFVGDGINDAPVLAGADVGAAMGSGSDAAIEAADVVFMTSSLQAIPQCLNIARVVGTVATQNIVFALVIKIAVMALGFMGLASMWAAVFADVGVAVLCILNSIRVLYKRY